MSADHIYVHTDSCPVSLHLASLFSVAAMANVILISYLAVCISCVSFDC